MHIARRHAVRFASLALLLCGTALPALAAGADAPAEGETIVVTGQRAAEKRAIDRKRAAETVQDSVSATDVGKLPDQNVAEAIKRLPGISVANDQGEGRYVVIRGVDPNLANVTLNGQTAAAPEPGGRQVKLDDLPSSLIGSVDVIKSLTPDRDANAIAGQVDINTLSAFDRKGTFVYARGAYGYYDLNKLHPFEADATVGTRVGDFGLVLSGNVSRRPMASENVQGSTNWSPAGLPDDFRIRSYNLTRKRYGLVGNVDWRPSDAVQLYLRSLYSKFEDHETRDQFRIALGTLATPAFTTGRGTRFVRRRNEDDTTTTFQGGGKFKFDDVKLSFDGTYSKALKKDPLRSEWQFRTSSNAIKGTVDVSDPLFTVTPGAASIDVNDPSRFSALSVNYDRRRAVETLKQFRADLEVPVGLGEGSTVKIGAKFLDRDKRNNRDYQTYDLNGFNLTVAADNQGNGIYDDRYPFGPRVDYDRAQAYIDTNPARAVLNSSGSVANSLVNDYIVGEEIWAGYAMATLKLDKLTLVPGVRVEHTKATYQAKTILASSTAAQGFNVTGKNSYTDVFPGLNVRYDATDRLVVRAGATTSIGRPNYEALAPYVQVDAPNKTVSMGNPSLKALRAVNGDLSVEYYLPGNGLFSVAGFYKHIDDPIFITGSTASGTFGGVALTNANVTQPINADSSEVYGVEFNLQMPLSFLPSPLDGLGVNLNYTRTGGSSQGVPGRTDKVDNYLQSRDVASAQVYYEKGGVALRVAYSYRSHMLDTVGTSAATDQYTDHNGQLDARASYALFPHTVVFVEGSNLTDAKWRRYIGVVEHLAEQERYSWSMRGGVQLAF